jgi:two-component sensor histidine kinase
MYQLLRQFYYRITRFGTHTGMDELQLRHAGLINTFYFVSFPAFVGSMIQTYLVDGPLLGNAMLGLNIVYLLAGIFLYTGKFVVAEFTIMIIANISIFFFHNVSGVEGGIYIYFFPLLIMMSFLSDFRRFRYFTFHVIISLITLLLCVIFERKLFWFEQPADALALSFRYNLIASAVLTGFCTFIIIRMNYREYNSYKLREKEREESQQQMQQALREKEMLLAEIHHRVKNNLSVISSLLNLQMNSVSNDYTRQILLESRNRVASMALIHQKLYRSKDNAEDVDFDTYIHELVEEIRVSYPFATPLNIQVNVNAQRIPLNLTTAIPCGLILNELLTNCYKHAFTETVRGEITITFAASALDSELYELTVKDNGKGLPDKFIPSDLTSLGITIVESLTEQLDGKLSWSSDSKMGTVFCVQFRQSAAR